MGRAPGSTGTGGWGVSPAHSEPAGESWQCQSVSSRSPGLWPGTCRTADAPELPEPLAGVICERPQAELRSRICAPSPLERSDGICSWPRLGLGRGPARLGAAPRLPAEGLSPLLPQGYTAGEETPVSHSGACNLPALPRALRQRPRPGQNVQSSAGGFGVRGAARPPPAGPGLPGRAEGAQGCRAGPRARGAAGVEKHLQMLSKCFIAQPVYFMLRVREPGGTLAKL